MGMAQLMDGTDIHAWVCSTGSVPCARASAHLTGVFLQHTEVGVRCRPPTGRNEDAVALAAADKCLGHFIARALHSNTTITE